TDAIEINAIIRSLNELRQKRNEPNAHITIYLKGVFNIYTHIDLPSNISLIGLPYRDRFKPLLRRIINNDYQFQLCITNLNHSAPQYNGNKNIIIENLEIDYSNVNTKATCIFICHSENIIIRRCKITVGTINQGHPIEVNACRNVLISDNEIIFPSVNSNTLESIQIDTANPGTQVPLLDRTFNADNTSCEHVVVMRNWLNGCNVGIGTHNAPSFKSKVYIYENLIEKLNVYGIRNYLLSMCIRNNQIRNQSENITWTGNKYGITNLLTGTDYSLSAVLGNNISNLMNVVGTELIRGLACFSGVNVLSANNIHRIYTNNIFGFASGDAVRQCSMINNCITIDASRDTAGVSFGENITSLFSMFGLIANDSKSTRTAQIIFVQPSNITSLAGIVTPEYTGSIVYILPNNIMKGNTLQFIGNSNTAQGFYILHKGTTTGSSQNITTTGAGTNSKLNVSANSLSAIDAFISSNTVLSFTASAGQTYWAKTRQRT
ncbi:MAG: hypothetical protein QXO37_09085, partial [Candidatus Nitrosocaldaceae archaeon]